MEKFLEMGERDVPFDIDEADEEEANLELYGDGEEAEGDGQKGDVKYNEWFAPRGRERYACYAVRWLVCLFVRCSFVRSLFVRSFVPLFVFMADCLGTRKCPRTMTRTLSMMRIT
jgi:hypothetical protein